MHLKLEHLDQVHLFFWISEIAGVVGGNDDDVMCYNVNNKYYSATIHLYCEHIPAEGAEAILLIINIGQVITGTHSNIIRDVCPAGQQL